MEHKERGKRTQSSPATQSTGIIKNNNLVKVEIIRDNYVTVSGGIMNHRPLIKKVGANLYVDTRTGEVFEGKINAFRSLEKLQRTNKRIKKIIMANTLDKSKIILLGLTYAVRTLAAEKVQADFAIFIKRLRAAYMQKYSKAEYIYVIELNADLQGFHLHVLLFFHNSMRAVFLPVDHIKELWEQGGIKLSKARKKGEIYHYLVPHYCKVVTDENRKMHEKALRQLKLPIGLRYYRCSSGIRRPSEIKATYETTLKFLANTDREFVSEVIYKNPVILPRGNNTYYIKQRHTQKPE